MANGVYNPQERTFIRRPEPKKCITCGQEIHEDVKPLKNDMANYIDDRTGKSVIINSDQPYLTIQDVKLRRETTPKESSVQVSAETKQEPKPAPRG